MTVFLKELRCSYKSLIIWSCSVAAMVFICILMYPEMKTKMDSVNDVFSNMGGFTSAFGMDRLNIGELMGFYGIECGNALGIGGGMFAALAGIAVFAKEEKERTAEFLLTHPINRFSVITQKLISVFVQIVILNVFVVLVSILSAAAIGETFEIKPYLLLHLAFFILQIELSCVCFGISAFIRQGNIGIGLGLALLMYFINIISNISSKANFLKYVTPYAYAEPSNIISESELDLKLILVGIMVSLAGIIAAYAKYNKKDITV